MKSFSSPTKMNLPRTSGRTWLVGAAESAGELTLSPRAGNATAGRRGWRRALPSNSVLFVLNGLSGIRFAGIVVRRLSAETVMLGDPAGYGKKSVCQLDD
jgi:hypothetical protein